MSFYKIIIIYCAVALEKIFFSNIVEIFYKIRKKKQLNFYKRFYLNLLKRFNLQFNIF